MIAWTKAKWVDVLAASALLGGIGAVVIKDAMALKAGAVAQVAAPVTRPANGAMNNAVSAHGARRDVQIQIEGKTIDVAVPDGAILVEAPAVPAVGVDGAAGSK